MMHLVPKSTTCGLFALMVWTNGCACLRCTPTAQAVAANPASLAGTTVIFVESPRDIFQVSCLPDVAAHFEDQGISTLYYDPWVEPFNAPSLAEYIRYVKCNCGQKVMLVGWSLGTAMSLDAIDILGAEGVSVDTFVALDCFNLNFHRQCYVHPPNIGRMVVVRSTLFAFPEGFNNPVTHVIDTCNHFAVPTHPQTLEMLFSEAALLGASRPPAVMPSQP